MNRIYRAVAGLALGMTATLALAPAASADELDRGPGLYPQCKINGTAVPMRTIIDQVEAASPDRNTTTETAPLYVQPTATQRQNLATGLGYVAAGLRGLASQALTLAGYEVCQGGVDSVPLFYSRDVLVYDNEGRSTATTQGRPMLVFRETATGLTGKGMILGLPHLNEDGVRDMALNAFAIQTDQVRAAVLAGTHRCNRLADSADDGSTHECGGHYKISDMAHQFDTAIPTEGPTDFQVMHDELREHFPEASHLQVHGMANGENETGDEGFEVSDGGNNTTNPAVDEAVERAHAAYSAALTTAMEAGGLTAAEEIELGRFTTCQAYSNDADPEFEVPASNRHCGRNSDQGQIERADGFGPLWLHIEISEYIRNTETSDPAVFNAIQQMITAVING